MSPGWARVLAVPMILVSAVILLALTSLPAHAQLSPGPLSEGHSSLDGILQCTSCHALGFGEASFKCMDCHTEIRDRVRANRGYHARLAESHSDNTSCVGCHAEHNGRDFEILTWPDTREGFDHSEAGYLLEGAHARVDCADCHTPENMTPSGREGILMDIDRSMLGLDPACLSCHEDEHRGQLSDDCTGCHALNAWTPVPGFRHQEARFALTGLHSSLACEGCHPTDREGVTRFTGIAFGECEACHEDPHRGGFDAKCDGCHSTAGWNDLSGAVDFDHSATRFPLEGAHVTEACGSCHETNSFADAIAHDFCRDCHADYHQGQFASRTDGGDCESCHSVETFDDSSFTAARHDDTAYPLIGMHIEVDCDSCHEPASEATDYHPPSELCLDCHEDGHDGQFGHLDGGACESCHGVEGFRPSTYTLRDHERSRFPLDGAHLAVVCFDCHTPLGEEDSGLQFRMDDRSCEGCHEDPHVPPGSLSSGIGDCEGCHQTRSWDLSGFDHQTTGFELLGAHRGATCESCHEPAGLSLSGHLQFTSAPEACSACHEDVHDGQFTEAESVTACDSCHTSATWDRIDFDHEEDSSFALEGAHEEVACILCHVERVEGGDAAVRVFRGTPAECEECH